MASPDKKQKVESKAQEKKEELEQDAKRDRDPKITQKPAFLTADTTLNVLPSTVTGILSSMRDGGLGNLVAGARANIGISSGRYMFEAKIVECSGKKMVRFGFSAEGSLFLGEDENSICFDQDGFMITNQKKTKCSHTFGHDTLVAVVLNLDKSSPNKDTISFFKNGIRVSDPQPLPDALKGKTLYPAVSFKHATVHLNFSQPAAPLPFTCKVIAEATQKEATVTKYDVPSDGKHTALFPVSMPDEGTFDYLDSFLEKNPQYTELSDRAFADWALKSGMQGSKKRASNDKPELHFGHGMDDTTAMKKALMQIASMQPRDFVIMEVKGNLLKEERAKLLESFKTSAFKTVAEVVVGEPSSAFKRIVQAKTLERKQAASDKEFKLKKAEEKRQWIVKKKQKEAAKLKKQQEKERKKKAEEIKRKADEVVKKRKQELAAKQGKTLEEEPEAKAPEPVESEEEPEEPMEPEPVDEEPPKVSLTAEDKATRFAQHDVPDLTSFVLNTKFQDFTLPDKDEGFDSIRYTWNKDQAAAKYVKEWIQDKKATTRVETIAPGAEFKKKLSTFKAALSSWKAKQNEYKNMLSKKAAAKAAKAAKRAQAEKKAKELEEKRAKAKAEGKELPEEKEPEAVSDDEEEPEFDFSAVDIYGVDDIMDVGNKIPLCRDFQFEDFTLLSLRAELCLLVHSFGEDSGDPDRTGVHADHLPFYYEKYYNKALNLQSYGVDSVAGLVALIDDTVSITTNSIVECLIPSDLETYAVFLKLTEDARRLRNMHVDMGDESAKLKIKGGSANNSNNNPKDGNTNLQEKKRKFEDSNDGGGKAFGKGKLTKGSWDNASWGKGSWGKGAWGW